MQWAINEINELKLEIGKLKHDFESIKLEIVILTGLYQAQIGKVVKRPVKKEDK